MRGRPARASGIVIGNLGSGEGRPVDRHQSHVGPGSENAVVRATDTTPPADRCARITCEVGARAGDGITRGPILIHNPAGGTGGEIPHVPRVIGIGTARVTPRLAAVKATLDTARRAVKVDFYAATETRKRLM